MRVCVTGATGFVGRRLSSSLAGRGHSTIALVRDCERQENVADWQSLIEWNAEKTNASIEFHGADAVVHLAARVHVASDDHENPLEAFRRVNVGGTLELARRAAEQGVPRFVFVSSIGVNGNETEHPFTEADVPAPQEPYAVSKHEAEHELRALERETGLEVVIIRPPMVYGPNAPGSFGSLLRWVRKGVPLPLGAVTGNRRSLVALDNLVDLIVTCLDHPAAAGETFLVADGEDVSTAALLRTVGDALERPARLVPVPVWMLRFGATALGRREMARRLLGSLQVDAAKARDVLGWTPPITLNEGLRRAVAPLRG